MPEYPVCVERNAARRCQIFSDTGTLRHLVAHRDDARHVAFDAFHRLRECVAQAFDELKQRQVDVGDLTPEYIRPFGPLNNRLEIAEIFRRSLFEKALRE